VDSKKIKIEMSHTDFVKVMYALTHFPPMLLKKGHQSEFNSLRDRVLRSGVDQLTPEELEDAMRLDKIHSFMSDS